MSDTSDLQRIYSSRFAGKAAYRNRVWKLLARFFGQWIPSSGAVLDLGAGYCEFINNASARVKYAMDLNPSVRERAHPDVIVLHQDCSHSWPVQAEELDAVFTSNFLEHLPDKSAINSALSHAFRSLKPGGRFVALGPNIKYLPGEYWDFFDHHVELTELSLAEALSSNGFQIEQRTGRFLPYTMSNGPEKPIWMLRVYLALPLVWPVFGKQFLVIARKPA